MIKHRVSQEVVDLNEKLALAPISEEEIVQLVNWESGDVMWADREFLRVIIPQALLDFRVGQVLNKMRSQYRGRAVE